MGEPKRILSRLDDFRIGPGSYSTVRAKAEILWSVILSILIVISGLSISLVPSAKAANADDGPHIQPSIAWTRTLMPDGTWQSVAAAETGVYAAGTWGIDRYDINGNRVWGRLDTFAESVALGPDGVYVLVGLDLVRKYDFTGNLLWSALFGYPSQWVSAVSADSG